MRKKILVLISEGGGGHKSAGNSLAEVLSSEHEVEIINGIGKILGSIDWFKILTGGRLSGEAIYNWCLQTQRGRFLKAYIYRGQLHIYNRKRKIASLFEKYLESQEKKPDLIISTIPLVNHGLITAAKKQGIPFLLLPTDLDVTIFLNGFDQLGKEDFPKFKLAIAYNRPELLINVFKHSKLEPDDLVFPGFPVRPACQLTCTQEQIEKQKEKFQMDKTQPAVTLIMGAAGSNGIVEHAKALCSINPRPDNWPIQVNVCVGRNNKAKTKLVEWLHRQGGKIFYNQAHLAKIQAKNGITFLIRGFTEDIIPLLACSDLVISKTGSCTVNEAIYLGKKLLLDHSKRSTSRFLSWEEFNIWFVKRHRLGAAFEKSEDLCSLVPFILQDTKSSPLNFFLPDFQTNIKTVVQEFFAPSLHKSS